MINKIKFIDLFAGIGGFHKSLETVAKKVNVDIECVFVSEIDKEAIKTYSKNFDYPLKKIVNIRNIDGKSSQVPDHDFLFAGFPCQTFSNAGKKRGFLDEIRGTLFFDIAKILKNKKPKYIILENVKHLVNHDNGKTWELIISTLKKIGYIVPEKPLILSPDEFGIPQDRKRVFVPGVLKSKIKNKNSKIEINLDEFKKDVLKNKNIDTVRNYIDKNFLETNVDRKYFLSNSNQKYLIDIFEAWNEFLKNVKTPNNRTLPVIWTWELKRKYNIDNLPAWKKKYISDMRLIYSMNQEFIDDWLKRWNVSEWKKRDQKFEWQAGKDVIDIKKSFIQLRQSGIRCKRPIKFPTLVAMVQVPIIFDGKFLSWRHLTPRELANLQSFPKDYVLHNELFKESSDFNSYKQFGNSINLFVTEKIQEYLLKNF